jgi:hypothetical protein
VKTVQGVVREGQFSNLSFLLTQIKGFEGERIEIKICPHKPKRSHAQNRLLWHVYNMASAKSGHTSMEVHEGMGIEFRSYQDAMGMTHVRSTTQLDVQEMGEYIERVCYFFGLPVPGEEDDEF